MQLCALRVTACDLHRLEGEGPGLAMVYIIYIIDWMPGRGSKELTVGLYMLLSELSFFASVTQLFSSWAVELR